MRSQSLGIVLVSLIITIIAVGCEQASIQTKATPEPSPPAATPPARPQKTEPPEMNVNTTPTSDSPKSGLSAGARALFSRAREDLAQRKGLRLEAIRLVSVESVRWPDASLGCPQPGHVYAQVITPGFRVVLRASGQVYTYHADQGQRLVLCEEESGSSGPTPPSLVEPGLERLANQAREDLARRLSIPVEQIEVLESRSVVWPDGGLGCPEPDMAYTQVQQEGVLIRLRAGQRIYSYHGGVGTPPFLCERATTDQPPSN